MTTIDVKGVRIGEGRPKTIVSLMDASEDELLRTSERAVSAGADCVEWRADFFGRYRDRETVAHVGRRLRASLTHTPLVFTFRSAQQGGQATLSSEGYRELLSAVIQHDAADLVDIEACVGATIASTLIGDAHKKGMPTIVSNHDFARTPHVQDMVEQLKHMAALGADLPKLAVMAQSAADCMRLMEASAQAHDTLQRPLITMAMGEHGKLSRLAGEACGSALTFCALGRPSAPGQVGLREATELLDCLHNTL